jgi:hypothetical protein
VPFVSQAQRSWMYSNHPKMAARWEAVTPKGQQLPGHSSPDSTSEETNARGVRRLPRRPGAQRDYAHLSPDQFARHTGRASEREAMSEGRPEAHFPDGRGEKMSLSAAYTGLQGRDVKRAARSRV